MEEDRGRGKIRKRRRKSLRVLRVTLTVIRFFAVSAHLKVKSALLCQKDKILVRSQTMSSDTE